MQGRTVSLDARLSTLAELVPITANLVADVGADHGLLAAALLQARPGLRMIVADISTDSLDKARRLLAVEGLADRVRFCVADGLAALAGDRPDAIVLAGMGAKTIREILTAGATAIGDAYCLLQPNLDAPRLRQWLVGHGFYLVAERVVAAQGRHYVVLVARRGPSQPLSPKQCALGSLLMAEGSPAFRAFLHWRRGVLSSVLRGLTGAQEGSGSRLAARRAACIQEIGWIDEELEDAQQPRQGGEKCQ